MDVDEFASFASMLDKQDADESFCSVPDQGVAHLPQDDLSNGPDLGNALDSESVQSCPDTSEYHDGQTHHAAQSDTPFSRADVNKALFEARLQNLSDTELEYPWESGVMGNIFSGSSDALSLPGLPAEYLSVSEHVQSLAATGGVADAAQKVVSRDLDMPFYSFAVKVRPDKDIFAQLEVLWTRAIDKWLQVFEVLGFPGELGAALENELHFADPAEHGLVLRDALGVKSPRTAIKRGLALLQYFKWLQDTCAVWDPWNRVQCLAYLSSSDARTPSASLGISFLEALRFARYVMQIPIHDTLLSDPQLKGRAQRLLLTKDAYCPARPLKAQEVALLERMMLSKLDTIDLYMLGSVLFAIFSRSRWSDLQHMHRLWLDRNEFEGQFFGFVETETAFHKTATSLKKKMRFIPVVCPIQGITEVDWTPIWLGTFEELKVDRNAIPFGPLCRAPGTDGLLCKRSCTSDEISAFINKVLKTAESDRLTSHSFKHTTLSWSASYGIDEPARTLLGHHELQGSKSMSVYSRDMLTRPLQLYCSMLVNIRGDHFRPDESRTSRMIDLMKIQRNETIGVDTDVHGPQVSTKRAPGLEPDIEAVPTSPLGDAELSEAADKRSQNAESAEDSDSLASTSSSSSEAGDVPMPEAFPSDDFIPGPVLRNIKSHVVHKCSEDPSKTLCGRFVSDSTYELLMRGCSTLNARCSRCYKGQVITSSSAMAEALDAAKAKRLKRA